MTIEYSPSGANSPPNVIFESRERRTVASYERELHRSMRTETGLRQALAREEALLRQKDELIQQQRTLGAGIRSSAVERPANDRKPAFAAKPGIGECPGGFAIGRRGRSCRHDRAHPPASPLIRRRTNLCPQALP